MQSSDEGQAHHFSRREANQVSLLSETQEMPNRVLNLPVGLNVVMNNAFRQHSRLASQQGVQHVGAIEQNPLVPGSLQSYEPHEAHTGTLWTNGQAPFYSYQPANDNITSMNSISHHPGMNNPGMHNGALPNVPDPGGIHPSTAMDNTYQQQPSYGMQPQHHFAHGAQNSAQSQLAIGTRSVEHSLYGHQTEAYAPYSRPQRDNPNLAGFNQYNTSAAANHGQVRPFTESALREAFEAASAEVASVKADTAEDPSIGAASSFPKRYDKEPVWLRTQQPTPDSMPQHPSEVDAFGTPPRTHQDIPPHVTSDMKRESDSPPRAVGEQFKGSQTQADITGTLSSECSPHKSVTPETGKQFVEARSPPEKRMNGACPNPSIDLDNEDNDTCTGGNRRLHEETIDLSTETNEEQSKLKKQGKWKKRPGGSYKIPSKKNLLDCNETKPSGFQDPLNNQTGHIPRDPPPKPFPKEPNVVPSPRRSRRLTSKSQRGSEATSPTNSGNHSLPQRSRGAYKLPLGGLPKEKMVRKSDGSPTGDCQLPLGGLPKEKRVRKSDGNSFMHTQRSTAKRRRPSRANEANPLSRKSHERREVEKRSLRDTQSSTRKKKQDARKKSGAIKSSRDDKQKKQEPIVQSVDDDDSDDGFSAAMRQRKVIGLESLKEHPGDSPLSNTVGDGTNSDDDDIAAGGHELSSDDDTPAARKTSTREQRNRHGNARKRSQKDHESPRMSRAPRRKTSAATSLGHTLNDSDDENFAETGRSSMKNSKESAERRRSNCKKSHKQIPSSPIDLVSPPASLTNLNPIRRSPRIAKKIVTGEKDGDVVSMHDSDEDFDGFHIRSNLRKGTNNNLISGDSNIRGTRKRLCSSKEQDDAKRKTKKKKADETNVESSTSDPAAESPHGSQGEEGSDASGEFLSQEQGSQPIQLKVRYLKNRKKANPKEYAEQEFKKMCPDELSIIRVAFIKRYPAPPSNMQAQGRYEAAYGTAMTEGMVQRTWETQLKPWSDRWWKLYLDFNQVVRQKKLRKPRNKDPTIKEKEVKAWVEEYYQEHGDARPTARNAKDPQGPQDITVGEKIQ